MQVEVGGLGLGVEVGGCGLGFLGFGVKIGGSGLGLKFGVEVWGFELKTTGVQGLEHTNKSGALSSR